MMTSPLTSLISVPLPPRLAQIRDALCTKADIPEIATSSGLTISSVNTYVKRIYALLGVHSRHELMAVYFEERLAEVRALSSRGIDAKIAGGRAGS